MIYLFLTPSESTVCGSIIYVLVKRYPSFDLHVDSLIGDLRGNHVFVYFIVHTKPSGGDQTQSLFDMSSRTNGFTFFSDVLSYAWVANAGLAILDRPYQFLAKNYVVSGQGRLEIPSFKTPNPSSYSEQILVVVTVQDHAIDSNFISLNYTIADIEGNVTFYGPDLSSRSHPFGSGSIEHPFLHGLVEYKMTIDYNYASSQSQVIEVRMYSIWYHNFLPFASN
uniref:Lectin_legB domain-containing protein n=1 Tax=Caenorhabditis tropicalis TaxID=1561998 RepID=A0A1I7TUI6_9PELO